MMDVPLAIITGLWAAGIVLGLAIILAAGIVALLRALAPIRLCMQGVAGKKATKLLLSWLSQEQRQEFLLHGYFHVRGSHTGRRYRIEIGLIRCDNGSKLCLIPAITVPLADAMLARKIAFETDESRALAIAHKVC